VLGSVGGGAMLSLDLPLPTVFLIIGLPALVSGAIMFAMGRYRAERERQVALAAR